MPVVAVVMAGAMLASCAGSRGDADEELVVVAPDPARDNSSPEAALAAIYAELHEGDVQEACTYVDETFKAAYDCEEVFSWYDDVDLEQMVGVQIDGDLVYYNDDGTAHVRAVALSWPDGRLVRGEERMFIERGNGWFLTLTPFP